ncbi:iron-sulfur cluster biosynthesis family protein [Paenibacillus sp. GCM10012306]|uniref:iron-sulfur cluster biosynthesis family protein n=1 Tax=Paenibacillus sp. GCM10012306 TaxID=3317342 RepID=UPI003621DB85
MIIQVTSLAERKLKERLGDQPGVFKLFYDTVGCGCDGINVILIVDHAEPGDQQVDAGALPFIISGQQAIFYEDKMRLDGEEHFSSFKLSSDSQLYSKNILVRDLRGQEAPLPFEGAACEVTTTR